MIGTVDGSVAQNLIHRLYPRCFSLLPDCVVVMRAMPLGEATTATIGRLTQPLTMPITSTSLAEILEWNGMAPVRTGSPFVASKNKSEETFNMHTIQYLTPAIEELELSLEGVLCSSQNGTEDLFEQEGEW